MREIRSPDNARVKRALKLRDSARERRKTGLAVLDGIHLVAAYIGSAGAPQDLFVSRSHVEDPEIASTLSRAKVEAAVVSDRLFTKLSSVDTPTGIVAVIEVPRPAMPESPGSCVFLEEVQDPGNVGSILRSAAAASVGEIYLSRECADAWSPRVLRAAMGAHFGLRIFENVEMEAFTGRYPGRVIAAAVDGTKVVFDTDLRGTVALAFGNEGSGITPALRAAAHATVSVPISRAVESLNVAAAAAVCLFERVRQGRQNQ